MTEQREAEKRKAARAALGWVRDGMVMGLGSGSTASYFIFYLGEQVRRGELRVRAVASSEASRALAEQVGIPLVEPIRGLHFDLTVDGADEITPDLKMIKGRGGALLREKVIREASATFVVIADGSKRVGKLGAAGVPVEVVPFALPWVMDTLSEMGAQPEVQAASRQALLTDQGNRMVICRFGLIDDPAAVAARLNGIAGVVEHGLFLRGADAALIGDGNDVTVLRPWRPPPDAEHPGQGT